VVGVSPLAAPPQRDIDGLVSAGVVEDQDFVDSRAEVDRDAIQGRGKR
jgi:hypothetical protein